MSNRKSGEEEWSSIAGRKRKRNEEEGEGRKKIRKERSRRVEQRRRWHCYVHGREEEREERKVFSKMP